MKARTSLVESTFILRIVRNNEVNFPLLNSKTLLEYIKSSASRQFFIVKISWKKWNLLTYGMIYDCKPMLIMVKLLLARQFCDNKIDFSYVELSYYVYFISNNSLILVQTSSHIWLLGPACITSWFKVDLVLCPVFS